MKDRKTRRLSLQIHFDRRKKGAQETGDGEQAVVYGTIKSIHILLVSIYPHHLGCDSATSQEEQ